MGPLTLIVAIGIILSLPQLTFMSLEQDGATEDFNFNFTSMTVATALGTLAIWATMLGTEIKIFDRSMMILFCGMLSLAAWIDRISAWTPDIIIFPMCILIFIMAPEVVGLQTFGAALGFGLALFMFGTLMWIPQEGLKMRGVLPADMIALTLPFILFRLSYETVAIYGVTAICLLGALTSKHIARIFSRPEAVHNAVTKASFGQRSSVTFLSVIFPIILIAIIEQHATF